MTMVFSWRDCKTYKRRLFESKTYLKETVDAIYEHDRGWIELDKVPILNDAKIFHIHLWIVQAHYVLFLYDWFE